MELKEHLKGYLSKHGLINDSKLNVTGNDPMYTILWMHFDELYEWGDKVRFFMSAFKKHQMKKGQFFRTPDMEYGLESIDNLIAWISLSPYLAYMVDNYLTEHYGRYPTVPNPHLILTPPWLKYTYREFLYKFPDFYAYSKLMAGKGMTPFRRFVLEKSFESEPEDDSGVMKRMLMVYGLKRAGFTELAEKNHNGRFTNLEAMFHNYFGDENHPLVREARRKRV